MVNLNSKLLLSANGETTEWDASLFDNINVVAAESPPSDLGKPSHSSPGDKANAILVEFASSADGRGFSVAASVRNQGCTDRLIAAGQLIPDQVSMAFQCGYDAVLVTPEQIERYGIDAWQDALKPVVNLGYAPTKSAQVKSIWKERQGLSQ